MLAAAYVFDMEALLEQRIELGVGLAAALAAIIVAPTSSRN